MSADGFLSVLAAFGDLSRQVDVLRLRLAGETARRREAAGGDPGADVAGRAGHRTAGSFLAELWSVAPAAARGWAVTGAAITVGQSLHGETLPAPFAVLEAACTDPAPEREADADGDADADGAEVRGVPVPLTADQACVIVRGLEPARAAVAGRPEVWEQAQRVLVRLAPSVTLAQLEALALQVRARLDQDGIEPAETRRRARRQLRMTRMPEGMTRLVALLDPASAGLVLAAIDGIVGDAIRHPRFTPDTDPAQQTGGHGDRVRTVGDTTDGDPAGAAEPPETRSIAQLRLDALVELCRRATTCTCDGFGRAAVT